MSAHGRQHDDAPTVSLAAVPAEQAPARPLTCASCGAALVSDQRYCLSCGEPASPVRLAFLDVLESEQSRRNGTQQRQWIEAGGYALATAGWTPQEPAHGAGGWLRRNSALLSLLSLLVLCLIAGLLVGHWASGSKASTGPQVIKVEGLGALSNAGSTAPSSTTGAASAKHSSAAKEEAEESAEAAKETKAEKAPPPKPVKITPSKIQKLTHSTGKKHQEEINSLGAQPIETG
jgi:hypothetical protein